MIVTRRNDGASLTASFIWGPTDFILFAADLHLPLVLMPRTYAPCRVGPGQLIRDVGHMARVIGSFLRYRPDTRKDEKQALVAAGRHHPYVATALHALDFIQSGSQLRLVASVPIPIFGIMITDGSEIREILAQDLGDHSIPCIGIVFVIEVPLMQHHVCAPRLDHFQHGAGVLTGSLIADKGNSH